MHCQSQIQSVIEVFGILFSVPEPKSQVHYCDHALSVVRPSVVHFSHFLLLLWNRWTEFNETWQEARYRCPLPSLCFWADRKNKMAALASDWLRYFRLLLWNRWTEFNATWKETRSQSPLPSLCFLGRSEKQDGRPGLWLADAFLTSPLKLLNGIHGNLTGSKISTSSTKFVISGRSKKINKMAALASDWLRHFRRLLWKHWNLTGRKISTSSTKFVFVWANRKNKTAVPAYDWLRDFPLLLWNPWTELNETWQEARYQRPLRSLCFSFRSEKHYGLPGLWLVETFCVLFRNRWTEFKEIWQKARSQRLLPSLGFLGRPEKQDGRPATDRPSHFRRFWNRRTECNETWQEARSQHPLPSKISTSSTKFVFLGRSEKQNGRPASDLPRHFPLLLWNRWTEFNETWREARSHCRRPCFCFSCQSVIKNGRPGWFGKKVAHCTQVHDMWLLGLL